MAESTAKRTAAKKGPAKKAAAKKTPAKKATKAATSGTRRGASARTEAPPTRQHNGRGAGTRVAATARQALLEVTGRRAESVTGLERTDDGWTVEVEVMELERIPRTTDVMAIYEVMLDDDGELQGCRRVHRYVRGSAGDD
jgi:hypothetical protein